MYRIFFVGGSVQKKAVGGQCTKKVVGETDEIINFEIKRKIGEMYYLTTDSWYYKCGYWMPDMWLNITKVIRDLAFGAIQWILFLVL